MHERFFVDALQAKWMLYRRFYIVFSLFPCVLPSSTSYSPYYSRIRVFPYSTPAAALLVALLPPCKRHAETVSRPGRELPSCHYDDGYLMCLYSSRSTRSLVDLVARTYEGGYPRAYLATWTRISTLYFQVERPALSVPPHIR